MQLEFFNCPYICEQDGVESNLARAVRHRANEIIKVALDEGRSSLLESEAERIANLYGINVPRSLIATEAKQASSKARLLGFPVAMKILSKDILHKTNVGGVRLDINSNKDAEVAYSQLAKSLKSSGSKVASVLIQKMAPKSYEFVVGGLRDLQFGPTVMFGLGGIYIELFKDVAFRLAPLSTSEAVEMMKETKAYSLLRGFRGGEKLDVQAAAKAIVAVGDMMNDLVQLQSIDVNPLLVYSKGAIAVDVRMTLLKGEAKAIP
jgi:acyl-CoA synthetase (NDP forming)